MLISATETSWPWLTIYAPFSATKAITEAISGKKDFSWKYWLPLETTNFIPCCFNCAYCAKNLVLLYFFSSSRNVPSISTAINFTDINSSQGAYRGAQNVIFMIKAMGQRSNEKARQHLLL